MTAAQVRRRRGVGPFYRDRGLTMIGIQVQQIVDDGRKSATTYSLRYRIGADVAGDIFREYRVFALPTQFFIGTDGVVRQVVNGPLAEVSAAALVESILRPRPSGSVSPSLNPGPSPDP